jgi:hypothetical protein
VNNDSVGWHDELSLVSKTPSLPLVLLKLYKLSKLTKQIDRE